MLIRDPLASSSTLSSPNVPNTTQVKVEPMGGLYRGGGGLEGGAMK